MKLVLKYGSTARSRNLSRNTLTIHPLPHDRHYVNSNVMEKAVREFLPADFSLECLDVKLDGVDVVYSKWFRSNIIEDVILSILDAMDVPEEVWDL